MTASEQAILVPRPVEDGAATEEELAEHSRLWSSLHQAVHDTLVELRKYPENVSEVRKHLEEAVELLNTLDPPKE